MTRRTFTKQVGLLATVLALMAPLPAGADPALVPDRRVSLMPDTDLPGGDLGPVFDTAFEACVQACVTNDRCMALTYNQTSRACFPKSGGGQPTPYVGALSALLIDNAASQTEAGRRAAAADWLEARDREAALAQARGFAGLFTARASDDPTGDAKQAIARNDRDAAMAYLATAIGRTDQAWAWLELARQTLPDPDEASLDRVETAALLALNAYLRAADDDLAAQALEMLASAWERAGRGRDALSALRLAARISDRPGIADALAASEARNGFRVMADDVRSESLAPEICATFSQPLSESVDYQSFVRLPDTGLTVEARDDQLCIGGLTHGQQISIGLRRGLPSASGDLLARDVEIKGYVRDRAPSVRFPGRSYVLPARGDQGLAMATVNLDQVDLRLMRISDRNLIGVMQDNLFARPLDAWSARSFNDSRATQIWQGTASVPGAGPDAMNRDLTTRLAIPAEAGPLEPGIYVLQATVPGRPEDETGVAAQWFVISDLGISTLMGADGLTVVVRGLGDAGARPGTEVALLSRSNAVLATVVTDDEGVARFDAGATRGTGQAAPALVMASQSQGEGVARQVTDMAFLSLTDPEFDLSDRGVEGMPPSPPIDVFATLDRGAYRAGEVMNLTVLARDSRVQALDGVPLTAILYRPDGVEAARQMPTQTGAGGYVLAFPIADTAPRGTWRIDIRAEADGPALASVRALVEDFMPERIGFSPALPEGPYLAGDDIAIALDARWLFGAPAAELPVEGFVTWQPAQDLPGFAGMRFGRHDSQGAPEITYLPAGQTDAQGRFDTELTLPVGAAAAQTARFTLQVREGAGRPVERTETRLVLPDLPLIGIRPLFEGDTVSEGSEARFAFAAAAPDLTPADLAIRWTLNRIETDYQWYALDGQWNWETITRRRLVSQGDARAGGAGIAVPVDWGQYELVAVAADGQSAAASVQFWAGWGAAQSGTETPDRLSVSLDKPAYQSGEVARVRVAAQSDATALVSVLSNRVVALRTVALTEGDNLIELPVTDEWGAGAYVTVSALRPLEGGGGTGSGTGTGGARSPARALGLAYAPVDPGARALQASIEVAPEASPRATLPVTLRVAGAGEGAVVHATVAVVDQGILNLTGFASPDPRGHYLGQRRLGVGLRDLYGRLILPTGAPDGALRSGGDAAGGLSTKAPPPTERLMSWFSGPVTLGPDGTAQLEVPVPDFNGEVRVMAVAWSDRAIGQAEATALIRDPVVMTVTAPRFLSPGDQAQVSVALTHVTGPAGTVTLAVTDQGEAGLNPGAFAPSLDLPEKGSASVTVPLDAGTGLGLGQLRLTMTTPAGAVVTKDITIPVSLAEPDVTRQARLTLAPGETAAIDRALMSGLTPDARLTATAGAFAALDVAGALGRLSRYPYGCTEQLASVAMPLIYMPDLSAQTRRPSDAGTDAAFDPRKAVQDAITTILTRQTAGGSFGLWAPDSGDLWLDAYVTDFLSRARAGGFAVPDQPFATAITNLQNRVNYATNPAAADAGDNAALAYASAVLARERAARIGDLRYYADAAIEGFSTPMAAAQIGQALATLGDQPRADRMFAHAAALLSAQPAETQTFRSDYGTALRDRAAVLAAATESGSTVIPPLALTRDLSRQIAARNGNLSTQESVWTVLSAHALGQGSPDLAVDGQPLGAVVAPLSPAAQAITNTGTTPTEVTLTAFGQPVTPPQAGGSGYAISRSYYDLDGQPMDPALVALGTRMAVVIEVTPFARAEGEGGRLIVNDPLPAGFEIDNPNLLRAGDISALSWLDDLADPEMSQFLTDRFTAAVNWTQPRSFRLAYLVRAVTPGVFRHPAASVEDMYRPDYRGWSDGAQVRVVR